MNPRRKWAGLLLVVAMVLALIASVVLGERKYRGRTLHEWLRRPVHDASGARSRVQAIAENVAFMTNAVAAFHEAGPKGVKVLLRELASPENRLDWLQHELRMDLMRRRWLRQSMDNQIWHDPRMRGAEAHSLIGALPPLTDESFRMLTNEFGCLAIVVNSPGSSAAGVVCQRFGIGPSTQEIHESQLSRLSAVASWISKNGARGVSYLTNQMFTSTSTTTQGAVMGAFADIQTPLPETVPVAVHAARNPELSFAAAQLLTRMRKEPAVAIPRLIRSLTNNAVMTLSLLADWGTNAAPWLPQLLPYTTNSDPQVSFQAEIAVRKIQGR